MTRKRCAVWVFLIAALSGVAAVGPATAYAGAHGARGGYATVSYQQGPTVNVEVGFFHDELSPYGEWVDHPQYGWSWRPRRVDAGWRPYSMGRWVESDYGWTWVSDEPFGWATYHYGRWAFDPEFGWVWIPGTVWGPAWVSWQQGGGYVGWAPLPPAIGFQAGIGLHLGGLDLNLILQPRDYCFVEERSFLEPHVTRYFAAPTRNVTIIRQTTNITRYNVEGNRVINRGVPIDRIERATHRRVERLRVAEATSERATGVERDQVRIYRAPESRLRTVRVAERNNAGVRQQAPARGAEKGNEGVPRAKAEVKPVPEQPARVREKPQAQPQEAARQREAAAARQKQQPKPRPVREPQAQPQPPPPQRERQVQPPPERREERTAKPQPPPQPKAKPQDQRPPQEKAKQQEPPKERKPPQAQKPKHKPKDQGPPPPTA
jgi:hypothetical protein